MNNEFRVDTLPTGLGVNLRKSFLLQGERLYTGVLVAAYFTSSSGYNKCYFLKHDLAIPQVKTHIF